MKKMFLILAILLPIFLVTSCEGRNVTLSGVEPEERYPKEVPFEEYSLEGTTCKWINLEYDYNPKPPAEGNILIINSIEELGKYVECVDGSYSEIDFSKKTLLVVYGTAVQGFDKINDYRLSQLSANKYQLDIELDLNSAGVIYPWITALIVKKISKENSITLNIIAI